MQKIRDMSLDAVKGFAILLVMLGHCIILNHMEDGIVYDAIAAVQMPLFMAASGFLAGRSLQLREGRELVQKLKKRAVNYLVPFFAWIVVLYPLHVLQRLRQVLFRLDLGLWFLMVLFLMSAALYVAVWFRDCTRLGWGGFCLVLGIFAAITGWQYLAGGTFLSPHLTVRYLPFFLGGYAAGEIGRRQKKKEPERIERKRGVFGKPIFVCSILLLMAAVFIWLVLRYDMVTAHNRLEWLLQMTASACGTVVCGVLVYGMREGRAKKLLAGIGRYTLEIYVLHFHFARILGIDQAGLSLYSIKGMGAVLATFLLMSAITAALVWLLKKFWITDLLLFGKLR